MIVACKETFKNNETKHFQIKKKKKMRMCVLCYHPLLRSYLNAFRYTVMLQSCFKHPVESSDSEGKSYLHR